MGIKPLVSEGLKSPMISTIPLEDTRSTNNQNIYHKPQCQKPKTGRHLKYIQSIISREIALNSLQVIFVMTEICLYSNTFEIFSILVPRGSPLIFHGHNSSSSSINLTVGGLPVVEENGIIQYYNISFKPLGRRGRLQHFVIKIQRNNASFSSNDSVLGNIKKISAKPILNCSHGKVMVHPTSDIVSANLTNLDYYTEYYLKASACTVAGCGPFSNAINITTDEHWPSCSPRNLTLTAMTPTSLNITWIQPNTYCLFGRITKYKLLVYFASDNGNLTLLPPNKRKDLERQSIVTGLRKFGNYCATVTALTSKGRGPYCDIKCGYTAEDSKFFLLSRNFDL